MTWNRRRGVGELEEPDFSELISVLGDWLEFEDSAEEGASECALGDRGGTGLAELDVVVLDTEDDG